MAPAACAGYMHGDVACTDRTYDRNGRQTGCADDGAPLRDTGRIVGSTQYLDIQPLHRGVEVGWTWYVRDVWGTIVNPEAKYLMLSDAFEEWGAIRVTLKTDHENIHSQAAIKKLGARYEGTLRHHRVRPDGTLRDTVMFSVLAGEWDGVKDGLERRITFHSQSDR